MRKNGFPAGLAAFTAVYYAANCLIQSHMSLFYAAIPFDTAQIGAINAGVAIASMAAQPLWGVVGDRARSRRRLVTLLALASAGAAAMYSRFTAFPALLALACVFACFYTPIQPMGDAIMLRWLDARKQPFGPVRLAGGAAYAAAGALYGRVFGANGRARLVPIYAALMCVAVAASAFLLPREPAQRGPTAGRPRFAELFKCRDILRLLAFMAPVQVTMGFFYAFFSPHFMTLDGATGSRLGACFFLSALSEVPFLLAADRLFDRFGARRLMNLAAATMALRWLLLGLCRSAAPAMATQLLHGWGYIVMSVCMAKHISRRLPDGLQASGQMLLAVVSFGLSRAAGSLLGGLFAARFGCRAAFLACSGVCAATLAASALLGGADRSEAT